MTTKALIKQTSLEVFQKRTCFSYKTHTSAITETSRRRVVLERFGPRETSLGRILQLMKMFNIRFQITTSARKQLSLTYNLHLLCC